jgi:hypothetical protein
MKSMQSVFTSKKRNFAAMLVVMVALAGAANAEGHAHKGKKGSLKITAPTMAGDALLQPGDYTVRAVNSKDGPMVEFVLHTFDPTVVDSGLSPYGEEVVARVKSSEQALSAPPKQTQLQLEEANAVAVKIRGDAVEYLLEQPEGRPGAMADRPDGASQNGR